MSKQLGLGFKGLMPRKTDDQCRREKIFMDEMQENGPDPKEQEYLERERERMRLQRMAKPWHRPLSD
jgi:hypothetical protein